jgi:hypothetical protein
MTLVLNLIEKLTASQEGFRVINDSAAPQVEGSHSHGLKLST